MKFHTHIGRPVLDQDGLPTYRRIVLKDGRVRFRPVVDYVPVVLDPECTARQWARAAFVHARTEATRAAHPSVPSTGEPMGGARRLAAYAHQEPRKRLTGRQARRYMHKRNRAMARGVAS